MLWQSPQMPLFRDIGQSQQKQASKQPPTTTFLEFLRKMQLADLDAPLDPPMGVFYIDNEFNYLASHIDKCT